MTELAKLIPNLVIAISKGVVTALAPRNRRVTFAVLLGGLTIAAANWFAMHQPSGESVMGLGNQTGSAVLIPAYGGLVTGLVAGFSRRPLYADASAGTYAAFAGLIMLMVWISVARMTGDLPDGSGFQRLGPISGTMFVLVIGAASTFVSFPTAFLVMFTSRAVIPNNKHRYGWLIDTEYDPRLDYVTPGPENTGDLSAMSTARSRFRKDPPRYSSIPARFMDSDAE